MLIHAYKTIGQFGLQALELFNNVKMDVLSKKIPNLCKDVLIICILSKTEISELLKICYKYSEKVSANGKGKVS